MSVANNGKEAVAMWAAENFDVVFMDIQMPEMGGVEATQMIREQERVNSSPHTPIIAMTAHAMRGDREKCLAAGMDGYVSKPISANDLYQTIKQTLNIDFDIQAESETPIDAGKQKPHDLIIWSEFNERTGSDRDLMKELMAIYLDGYKKHIEKIRGAIAERNRTNLEIAAHTFKGTVSTFGKSVLFNKVFELEKGAQALEQATVELLFEDIEKLSHLLREQIDSALAVVSGNNEDGDAAFVRLKALVDSMQFAVLMENERRQIQFVNSSFCNFFDINSRPAEIIGTDCSQSAEQAKSLFVDEQGFVRGIEEILSKKETAASDELTLKDGRIWERHYVPVNSAGKYLGHFWMYRDVSEQKKLERSLSQSRDAAFEAVDAKSKFLASMSHEIRTPMNGVLGTATLLKETGLTSEQKEMVETITSCGDALMALIDDVLDFSAIEAGKLRIEKKPFDLESVVQTVARISAPAAREKNIVMSYTVSENVPKVVVGDHRRYQQILLNLVTNALKFTERGSVTITIDAQLSDRSKELHLSTSVADTGVGISEEQCAKLFEKFTQADQSSTRRFGGVGLGLAICRELSGLMGGKIAVRSQIGQGSEFTFSVRVESGAGLVPVNLSSQVAERNDTNANLATKIPLKILIAEDNAVNQQLALKFLKKLGYDADLVQDGLAATEIVRDRNYDLIFMDGHMPRLDGYDATRKIRLELPGERQPVIIAMMTASVMEADRKKCFDAGMDDFVAKPLKMDVIAAAIERQFSRKTMQPSDDAQAAISLENSPINVDELLRKFEGDVDLMREVATIYLEDYKRHIDAIEAGLLNMEPKRVAEAAHSLKGAANNFSRVLVTAAAAKIESLASQGDLASVSSLLERLKVEAEKLRHELISLTQKKVA